MANPSAGYKERIFWSLLLTQTLSLIGSRMTTISLGIWLYQSSGQTTPLLLSAFFNELPGMLFGSLAGVWVDRWPRKWTLALADAGQALGTLFLLFQFLAGRLEIWQIYAVAFFNGCFMIVQQPAEDATITLLVPDAWRERANALRQAAFPLASVVAPALAGMLYVWIGLQGIVLLDLVSFILAAGVVIVLAIPQPPPSPEGQQGRGHFGRELLAAWHFLAARPPLLALILFSVWTNFLLNGPLDLTIPYLITLSGSERAVAWVMPLMGLGAFSGALLMSVWRGTRPRIHTLLPVLLVTGCMFIVYGLVRQPLLMGPVLFLLIAPLPVSQTLHISLMQLKIPPDLQGRVFALAAQLGFVGSTLSFWLTGPLVDRLLEPAVGSPAWQSLAPLLGNAPGAGIGLVQLVVGLLLVVSTLALYAWPRLRRMEAELPDYL